MVNKSTFQRKISEILPEIVLRLDEPMAKHTSFRIGGPAQVMAFPKNKEELAKLLKLSNELDIKTAILGAGTNVLASDAGVEGLVICLKDCMDGIELPDETHLRVAAGVTMTRAAVFAAGAGLSGLEFAHGIPGTVGGGVYMNAGAYGAEIKDVCVRVEVMYPDGAVRVYSGEEMGFSYRHSRLEEDGGIVLSAEFALIPKPEAEIREYMQELMRRRSASQPLDKPSAGSAFKRPKQGYAAALIDQCGLKGYRVGDAAVSEKHAGFVVNLGNATAQQVQTVLSQVQSIVLERTAVQLEPEVRIW